VSNPSINIIPDIMKKYADNRFQTGSSVKRTDDSVTLPEVIVGMDVLRNLHIYIAFKEKKIYITQTSGTDAGSVSASGPASASAPPP
jgi:hypothetical protein